VGPFFATTQFCSLFIDGLRASSALLQAGEEARLPAAATGTPSPA
jgi:hypothetical protein